MRARFFAIAASAALLSGGPVQAEDLLIIANSSVNIAEPLSVRQLAAIYLLRITTWPDGNQIIPVNREGTSSERKEFTSSVLQEDNATLAAYWNEMHFQGKQPPVVQESDRAMLAFIQNVPGSVGYISASITPSGVKVLAHVP